MKERVTRLNEDTVRDKAEYVLYWTQMNRRVPYNHALAWAIERANELALPLLVYEGLTCSYPSANDRIHTFMLENVPDFAEALAEIGAGYCFYLRRRPSAPNDIVYRLARKAALVVTDDYPVFIAAKHNARVPSKIGVAFEAVDASCIVPMNLLNKREWAAYTIRPKINRLLPDYLRDFRLPKLRHRWGGKVPGVHVKVTHDNIPHLVKTCAIDHSIPPSTSFKGGYTNAKVRLRHFLRRNLKRYADGRNEPSAHATSNLSPWLHFGQISALEVALSVRQYGVKHRIDTSAFLEELIVRRELAFNFVRHSEYGTLESLPDWAKKTLAKHADDERPVVFTPRQMERAQTYDELWNATQKELLLRGKIHGYIRMYWGKKIIEWSRTYEEAFELMMSLHERYALDGRDPNTWTNVLWCFGLHDRPWTERPVFGQIRYMSNEGMKRKTDTKAYIREISALEKTGKDPARL